MRAAALLCDDSRQFRIALVVHDRKHNDDRVLNQVVDAIGKLVEDDAPSISVDDLVDERIDLNPVQSIIQGTNEPVFEYGIDLPVPGSDPAHISEHLFAKPKRESAHQRSD